MQRPRLPISQVHLRRNSKAEASVGGETDLSAELNEISSVEGFAEAHIAEYIRLLYHGPSDSGKTEIWTVARLDGKRLGQIKWFGRWRQYAWFPDNQTVYSAGCQMDIKKFTDALNIRQRLHRKQRASAPEG